MTENKADPLLPCPFCGPGQSMVDPWFDDVSKRWAVGCGRCGASSGRSVHAEGSKEAAIKSWNTRASGAPAKVDPLREALTGNDPEMPDPIQPIGWLKSMIHEANRRGPAIDCDDPSAYWEMVSEVELLWTKASAALAAPQPADDQDLVNMLWTWFEERGHDLREERTYGITADEFRIMLDEHEANLLPDGHAPPQPAAPLGGREAIDTALRTYFQSRFAPVQLSSDGVERVYCNGFPLNGLIDAIPQERGVDRAAIERLQDNVRRIDQCLADLNWRPSRAHLEGARNTMQGALAALAGKEADQ